MAALPFLLAELPTQPRPQLRTDGCTIPFSFSVSFPGRKIQLRAGLIGK